MKNLEHDLTRNVASVTPILFRPPQPPAFPPALQAGASAGAGAEAGAGAGASAGAGAGYDVCGEGGYLADTWYCTWLQASCAAP